MQLLFSIDTQTGIVIGHTDMDLAALDVREPAERQFALKTVEDLVSEADTGARDAGPTIARLEASPDPDMVVNAARRAAGNVRVNSGGRHPAGLRRRLRTVLQHHRRAVAPDHLGADGSPRGVRHRRRG